MAMNKQRRTSNIANIFSYDDAGNIVIKDYGQITRYSWNGLIHGFVGPVSISSVSAATTDTDRFLVSDGGVLKYRTGVELLSDIGGVPSTRTLTINGVTQDLSADRSWTIAAGITGSGASGQVTYWNGTNSQTGSALLTFASGNLGYGGNGTVQHYLFSTSSSTPVTQIKNSVGTVLLNLTDGGLLGLGTGTFTPTSVLHLRGAGPILTVDITTSASSGGVSFLNSSGALVGQVSGTGSTFSSGIFTGNQVAIASYENNGKTTIVAGGTSGFINFATGGILSGNERMRLTAAGRLLLGTTTEGTFLLDVNGTARVSGAMTISGLITAPSGLFASGVLDIYSDGSNGAIAMRTLTNTLCLRKYVKVLGDDGGFGNNNASAAFQIDGTNRGFLPPRLTTTQKNAIATPAAGLVVYDNTDNYLSLYNGTNWQNIVSPNSAGNVLIGVNTDLGYKLQLSSAIYTTNGGINSDLNNTINHALYAVNQSLTSAASNGIIYLETTWNTTGNPSAIYLNVTNTASGSFSKLLDLRVGLTPVFQVDKTGGVFTGQPIGGSNGVWKFGQYNATAPSATGYVEVEVNGTLYKLLAST